jgi:hypothetical protein
VSGGFILIALGAGLFIGALVALWHLGGGGGAGDLAPSSQSVRPVSVWPYILACYMCASLIVVAGWCWRVLWNSAPNLVLLVPFVAPPLAVWLFARFQHRGLLPSEKWWLIAGCSAVLWIYGDMQSTVVLVLGKGPASMQEILTSSITPLVDFVLAWITVSVAALWAKRHCASVGDARRLTNVRGGRDAQ